MWGAISAILGIVMKLAGFLIKKSNADAETEKKFLELAQHLQAKKLVSANIKWNRQSNLDELAKKREEARKLQNK